MGFELKTADPCCRQSLELIQKKLETTEFAKEFLAIAPTLAMPSMMRIRPSLVNVLLGIGKGIIDWRKNRDPASKATKQIADSRIRDIIDMEIVLHIKDNNHELHKFWSRLKQQFAP